MKIDKMNLMCMLNERQYLRNIHDEIKGSFIGCMFPKYLGIENTIEHEEYKIRYNNFKPYVDMTVAHMLNTVVEKTVDEVLSVITKDSEGGV